MVSLSNHQVVAPYLATPSPFDRLRVRATESHLT